MEIAVGMGEIKVSSTPHLLMAVGIGSCIALTLYDKDTGIAGLAHVMHPCIAEVHDNPHPARFADVAVDMLIDEMKGRGVKLKNIRAKIFGGANMFPGLISSNGNIAIGKRNILAVREELKRNNIEVIAEEVGGHIARTVLFDTRDGSVLVKTAHLGGRKY